MDKGGKGDREISVFLFVLPAFLRGIRKNHMTWLSWCKAIFESTQKIDLKNEIVTVYFIFWLIGIFFAYGEALKVHFYNWMKRKKTVKLNKCLNTVYGDQH